MKKRKTSIAAVLLSAAVLFLAAGCPGRMEKPTEPIPELVWPQPPETPRIRFVNAVDEPEDLGIRSGAFRRFFDYVAGKPDIRMVSPYGIETDDWGRIYVVDTFLRSVHVFDLPGNSYHSFPSEKGEPLVSPIDIAIDGNRQIIYVSDSQEAKIHVYRDLGKTHVESFGKEELKRPTGLAINAGTSELLVLDTQSGHVMRYDLGDRRLKGKFGGNGAGDGKLHYPTNICTVSDGRILVSDSLNFRIQVFSAEGAFLGTFGSAGDGPGYFSRPRGVAVDSDGNIYVVDALFDNIQVFDSQFHLLMAFGVSGSGYGELWLPTGIFIDKNDRIYVSDQYNKRFQIFQYLKQK